MWWGFHLLSFVLDLDLSFVGSIQCQVLHKGQFYPLLCLLFYEFHYSNQIRALSDGFVTSLHHISDLLPKCRRQNLFCGRIIGKLSISGYFFRSWHGGQHVCKIELYLLLLHYISARFLRADCPTPRSLPMPTVSPPSMLLFLRANYTDSEMKSTFTLSVRDLVWEGISSGYLSATMAFSRFLERRFNASASCTNDF